MWTFELFEKTRLRELLDGEYPFTKDDIMEYVSLQRAPRTAIEILKELDDDELYETVLGIWPDMPTDDDDFGSLSRTFSRHGIVSKLPLLMAYQGGIIKNLKRGIGC